MIFNDIRGTNFQDHTEFLELLKTDSQFIKDTQFLKEKRYRPNRIPVELYPFMARYFTEKQRQAESDWKPDHFDFAVMTVKYQQDKDYKQYWCVHFISKFLDIKKDEALVLVNRAKEEILSGNAELVKMPLEFYNLVLLRDAKYRNGLLLERVSDLVDTNIDPKTHKALVSAATKKIKTAVKKPDTEGMVTVKLTLEEAKSLTYDAADLINKKRKLIAKTLRSYDT